MQDFSLSPPKQNTLSIFSKIDRLRATQCVLLALYVLALALLLPIDRLGTQPMLRRDFSYHYSQIVELGDIIANQGDAWGYSARFFAGYPIGISSNLGSKGWTWFVYLLSTLSINTVLAFNLFTVLGWLMMPMLIYKAAREFELSAKTATLAAVIASIYWWGSYPYSFIANWGGTAFVISMPLALFALATFATYARSGRLRDLIRMGLVFALCGWVHILSVVIVLPGLLLLYALHFRRMRLTQHIGAIFAGIVALLLQLPWLGPFWKIKNWFVSTEHQMPLPAGGLDRVHIDLISLQPQAWLHRILIVAALAGAIILWRKRQRAQALFFSGLPMLMFALGYFGFGFGELQPARFIQVGYLWLVFANAVAARHLLTALQRNAAQRRRAMAIAAALLIAFIPNALLIVDRAIARPLLLINDVHPDVQELIEWLRDNTTTEGRILFQDSDPHWQIELNVTAGYIAYASQRDFIGGPYPWGGPLDFLDNRPFDRDIQTITSDQLAHYLGLYNIHWILVHTQVMRDALDANPQLVTRIANLPIAQIYTVNDPGDYFLKGSGRVEVNGNRIELYDLQGEEVILKYHWVPQLTSAPSVDISRFFADPDPYGFIRITNPPQRLTLWVEP